MHGIDTFKSVLSVISNMMKESVIIVAYASVNLGFLGLIKKLASKYFNVFKYVVMGSFGLFIIAKSLLICTTSETSVFTKISLTAFIIIICILFEILVYNLTVTQTTFMPTITKGRKLFDIMLALVMLLIFLVICRVGFILSGIDLLEWLEGISHKLNT